MGINIFDEQVSFVEQKDTIEEAIRFLATYWLEGLNNLVYFTLCESEQGKVIGTVIKGNANEMIVTVIQPKVSVEIYNLAYYTDDQGKIITRAEVKATICNLPNKVREYSPIIDE